ncbi:MAG: hypothetical protein HOP29_04700 [Phycisphaerales bacterium]|nr:hypothetical protein [Phycisphaerales bacterium]
MEPTAELIDDIYREKVLRARKMTVEEKLLAGPRLFEFACRIMREGIRMQHADFDDAAVEDELRRRLAIARRLEELA